MNENEAREMERSFEDNVNNSNLDGLDVLEKIIYFMIEATKEGTISKKVTLTISKAINTETLEIAVNGIRYYLKTAFIGTGGNISVRSEDSSCGKKTLIIIEFKKPDKVTVFNTSLN